MSSVPAQRAPRPPGPAGQVAALVALRIAALRGPARVRAAAGAAVLPGVAVAAVVTAVLYPREHAAGLVLLMPSAWLFFLVGAVVAAATGAGGRQLLPPDQAVAFPVSPAADHLGALVTAPLNVAWSVQAVTLLALTSWTVGPAAGLLPALLLTVAWIVCCTVVAQAAGWVVELARTTPAGVWAVRAGVVAAVLAAGAVAVLGRVGAVLDAAPTRGVVVAALAAGTGSGLTAWAAYLALLAGVTTVGWLAGIRLAARLDRRPALVQARGESRHWQRRPPSATPLRANLRVDHASVWRSAPLRRGIVALGVIPGAAAAASGLPWPMVALLPGLAASGAGLLFGVNAFALDGTGALWRETLPGPPGTLLAARLLVLAEVCLAGALVALGAAAARAGAPTPGELAIVAAALVATTAQVVARCARWSVERPYAAALREARDQPAPPAAMAGYSARLAVSTTCTGILYTVLAREGLTVPAVLFTCAFVVVAGRRLLVVARTWQEHPTRVRVLSTVAGARA
ncbi:MAG TPA: hypothetical protein VE781_12920 [Kineosporiaceae bacterium]|nr:hypothetical protein [Kineosporiaceae bacterium]